ncbi:cytochrome P450 315a1, mitochondrial [Zootermopsis nevadensis]|uniref:Cytochrome P450 315a1, mitochondrial n=1 Tax=Zootermopsis nevadensis TaxID=136037 RepID=A0A067RDD3_ZOONE|nr:cytochrome P450 315a1, mitochondrial [Zootermopsis nevadensis]KDR16797.1 Cytochrome P450 315a1, mitochondrial [Zootermopsis nevadensis]
MWRRAVSACGEAEMPSPRGLPFIGTVLDIFAAGGTSRLHEYVDARHRQLGPVYRESIGPVKCVFVSDPSEMRRVFSLEGKCPRHLQPDPWVLYNKMYGCKRGLFFMDGEEWLRFRRTMNTLMLRPDSGDAVVKPIDTVADELVARWARKYSGDELPRLDRELYRWAIDIMMAVLTGDKYLKHRLELEDVVDRFASVVHLIFEESARLSLIPAKMAAFLKIPAWKNFVSAIDEAISLAHDLTTRMIPECQNGEGLLGAILAEGIEDKDVIRIVADLFIGAGDTTANSTQWILYLLARNPNLQEELHVELQKVYGCDEVAQLPLLRGVVKEALRLYPTAPFLTRYLPQDNLIGGYHVPAGDLILLSIYTSGRDEKNFPKPNEFWPHRWTRDSDGNYKGVSNCFASLPFSMGARSCIGRKIADLQMTLTTAKVIQRFKMELIEKKSIDMTLRLVPVPSRPVRLRLTER